MARSKERGRGNYDRDEQWMEWMQEHGTLEVINPDEQDIPFPAKLQWSGEADDEGSPWQVPPPGQRCNGKAYLRDADGDYIVDSSGKRLMRPCWNWPMRGTTVCLKHGGGIARVKMAAIERMASAMDAATGQLVRLALRSKDEKVQLQAIKELMDRVGVRGGIEVDVKDAGYLDVLKGLFEQQAEESDAG